MSKLKLKYELLSKDEKNNLKEDFYNTEQGKKIKTRLNRVFIYGIIGILFSIYLFFSEKIIAFKVLAVGLLVVSIIFIISSFKIRINKLNEFLVSNKKNK